MKYVDLICKFCEKPFTTPLKRFNYLSKKRHNFYCSKKCFVDDKSSPIIIRKCLFCKNPFETSSGSNSKKCCSIKCSGSYAQTFINIEGISNKLKMYWKTRNFKYKIKKCKYCGVDLKPKIYRRCCSDICSKNLMSIGGRKSASVQKKIRRSKNEIYFSTLCKKKFSNVIENESIFNGWDADVILKNEKIAVLWNGNWHHKKITKQHSIKQVKNRDKIKLDEIKKLGYIPYIINDTGKFNPLFVNEEFKKFVIFINNRLCSTMVV